MSYLFVYGTLKKGFGLHNIIASLNYIGETKILGYDMYTNGGYPMAVKGWGSIVGEVYEVPEEVEEYLFSVLDQIEGAYNRNKELVIIDKKAYSVYFYEYKYEVDGLMHIEDGEFY